MRKASFLAVVVVCALTVGGLTVASTVEIRHINRVARQADRTAIELKQQGVARRRLRNEQVAQLHRQAVADCFGRHKLVQVLTGLTRQSAFPGLTAAQNHALAVQRRKALRALRNADCTHVKPLMKGT